MAVSMYKGYSPPGINMAMLLPFSNISSSLVILRPSGVISLYRWKTIETLLLVLFLPQNYGSLPTLLSTNYNFTDLMCLSNVPPLSTSYNSVTSSRTMLTKSSKPSSVPTISLSADFIMMCILLPIHLSTSSKVILI